MHNENYKQFIESKSLKNIDKVNIDNVRIHKSLFPFQRDCCEMLLKSGRGAAFLDTGLGKTILQCEWARHIPGDVLIIAPLAVAHQTVKEAKNRIGMDIQYSKDGTVKSQWTITNYERVENFDTSRFKGVVLDESSILKGQNSKTKQYLCNAFEHTPFKLACTATPAPNDYMELGNHSDFLGIMNQQEMLMRWFIHDSANTADWRLKGHAVKAFWQWVSSWAACVSKPSDLGYSNDGYDLPPLAINTHIVESDTKTAYEEGYLFNIENVDATSVNRKMRETVNQRVAMTADMVNNSNEPFIVWCESNQESEMLAKAIPDAVEVRGSDHPDKKEERLISFTDGNARVIVSKPSICGHGMNWQHCKRQVFCSVRYSYEYFYQAVRRSYRFGQDQPVYVDVLIPDNAIETWRAIERKSLAHEKMKTHMKYAVFNKGQDSKVKIDYNPTHNGSLPSWLKQDA